MLRTALLLSFALAAAAPLTAAAASDEADVARQRAEAYLGAIDRPVPASAWQALGQEVVPFLEETLRSDPLTSRRAAAAAGLAAIGGERAAVALQQAARVEEERWSVRATAVRGLGRVLPPDRLPDALRPILEGSKAVQVRALAAEVLSREAPDRACSAIQAQVAREAEAERAAYSKAAARCRAR